MRLAPALCPRPKWTSTAFNQDQPLASTGVVPTYFLGSANVATVLGNYDVALPGYGPFAPGSGIPFGGPQNFWSALSGFQQERGKNIRSGSAVR